MSEQFKCCSTPVLVKNPKRFIEYIEDTLGLDHYTYEHPVGTAYGFYGEDRLPFDEDNLGSTEQALSRFLREGQVLLCEESGHQWRGNRWDVFYWAVAINHDGRCLEHSGSNAYDRAQSAFGNKPIYAG